MIVLNVFMKGDTIMADFDFNAPYVDRRTWIIDHLQNFVLEPKEILVVLLIDFSTSSIFQLIMN